jgi:DnaJ-class molecular chaperone
VVHGETCSECDGTEEIEEPCSECDGEGEVTDEDGPNEEAMNDVATTASEQMP